MSESESVKERFVSKIITFRAGIAEHVGISAAIIFEHIIYWIEHNHKKQKKSDDPTSFYDGHWWMYESYDEMAEWIPFYERTCIVNGIAALEKAGYIVKGNNPRNKLDRTNWYRLSNEIESQIIFTKDHSLNDRKHKECSNDKTGHGLSSLSNKEDKINKEQQQPPAPAAVFSCLIPLGMPQSEKEWITKAYPEPIVAAAVKVVTHPSFKVNETLQQAVKHFCKNPSEPPKSPEETAAANKVIAKAIEAKATVPKGVRFEVLSKEVVIGHSGGNYVDSVIEYSTNGFKEQIESALRKHNIKW
jgi:hypothetical protein